MKSLREAIDNQRILKCRPINEDPETRMRHCESCEVPIGTMSLDVFNATQSCPVCGNDIHRILTKPEKLGEWITAEMAEIKYKVSRGTLYDLIHNGILTSKKAERGRVILESEIAAFKVKREWVT